MRGYAEAPAAGPLPRKTLRAVRHALAHHHGVTATLTLRVKDSAGNSTSKKLKLRLTK